MCFENRWKAHQKDLAKGKHVNIHLQRSYNKHGADAFKFEIAEELGKYDRAEYFASENALMDKLRAQRVELYNIAKAQGGWSFHDDETKAKIAKKVSAGVKRFNEALTADERSKLYGRVPNFTDDIKRKISLSLTGIKRSDETRRRMAEAQQERVLSEDALEAMRDSGRRSKGRLPPNTRKVIVKGVEYQSLKAAATSLNMSSAGLLKKIRKGTIDAKYSDPA